MAQRTNTKSNRVSDTARSGTIMGITLIISLIFHVCVLFGFQKAFPLNWTTKPVRTYKVELLSPPADPLDNKKTQETAPGGTSPQKKAPPEVTEDTISLDTKDKRYISYAKSIKTRLMNQWKYPQDAKEKLIEGKVLALFVLNRQGVLKDIRILESSGYDILDEETVRAIEAAAPFPHFPGSVTVMRLNIKANFAYRLTAAR